MPRSNSQIAPVEGSPGNPGGAAAGTGTKFSAQDLTLGLTCCHLWERGDFLPLPIRCQNGFHMKTCFFSSVSSHLQCVSFQRGASNVPKLGRAPGPNTKGGQKNQFLTSALANLASQSGKFPARNGAGQPESTSSTHQWADPELGSGGHMVLLSLFW